MTRQKNDPRMICYASIILLSLGGCSHQAGKLKGQNNITENPQATTTPEDKNSHFAQSGKKAGRLHRKKDSALAANGRSLSHYDNLWERLFDLYDLPPIEHAEIDRELEWFRSHPDYLDRVQQRAKPFLYSIVKQVEKHQVPGEIALLPVIESAFQPNAVSPAKAAGIWQFIPSTGRIYGLKKSRTYDGRRDVYASTKAAIKYLKKLQSDFDGDWLLAIAAYNCGEGAVSRAIQRNIARNLPTDFWSLDLPQETRSYVPRLLAVSRLFADAKIYGVDLHDIPNTAKFKPVKVTTQVDLALAADAADITLDKLYELNPGFKGKFADVPGSYHLFIPAEKKAVEFRQKLEKLVLENQAPRSFGYEDPNVDVAAVPSREPHASLTRGVEFSGEPTSSRVSGDPEGSSSNFQRERRETLNDRQMERQRELSRMKATLTPQSKVSVPSSSGKVDGADSRKRTKDIVSSSTGSLDRPSKKTMYTVQSGETLWAVARKHSVDVDQLAKWNQFPVTTNVKAGQSLVVWNKDAGKKLFGVDAGIRPSQSIRYTVQEGDTLFSISRRFNVSVTDLRKWNGYNIEKQMQPGRNIMVQKERE
jgi:membrane-bound lytic murein transglycosylase D